MTCTALDLVHNRRPVALRAVGASTAASDTSPLQLLGVAFVLAALFCAAILI